MPKTKSEKSEISKELSRLRDYGYLVFNFNQKQRFGKGLIGFCDHVIIGFGRVTFIEVKIGSDKYSSEQKKLRDEMLKIKCTEQIDYREINNLAQTKDYVNYFITNRYEL